MAAEKRSAKEKFKAFWAAVKRYAKRTWEYIKVAKMELIVLISIFVFDLVSKAIVQNTMYNGQTIELIHNFLNVHYITNPDAAFGNSFISKWFGPLGARIFYCVFAVAVSVILMIVLIKAKKGSKLFRISLAMLIAGAMGNCIDRWAIGSVRDFIEFVYFGETISIHFWFIDYEAASFYIFNIADASLVIGVIVIIVYFIFFYRDKEAVQRRKQRREAKAAAAATAPAEQNAVAAASDGTAHEQPAEPEPDTQDAATEDKAPPEPQAEVEPAAPQEDADMPEPQAEVEPAAPQEDADMPEPQADGEPVITSDAPDMSEADGEGGEL